MKKLFQNLVLAVVLMVTSATVNAQPWITTLNAPLQQVDKFGTSTNFDIRMFTNNKLRMTVTNKGKVGIGTSSLSPINMLNVSTTTPEDGIRVTQNGPAGGAAALHLDNATTGGFDWTLYSMGAGNTNEGTGNFVIYQSPSGVFPAVTNTPRLIIEGLSGNVGIGTLTAGVPNAVLSNKLEVAVTNPEDGILITQRGGGNNGAAGLHLKNNTIGGKMWSFYSNGSGNVTEGSGNFTIQESDGYQVNPITHFLIQKTTGDVGIGTLTPNEKLEVAGGDARIHTLTVGLGGGFVASNTALGFSALFTNSTGSSNTSVGYQSLLTNTTGFENTSIGFQTLHSNIDGIRNTAVGASSLYSNVGGDFNTATGYHALYSNTEGGYNTANGYEALYSNIGGGFQVNGSNNTANGYQALRYNTSGNYNVANGSQALLSNTTGSSNTVNGNTALYTNTTGSNNTADGAGSLINTTTGSNNTSVGSYALSVNTTGSNNTALGSGADVSANNLTFASAIGANAIVNASNKMQLGSSTAFTQTSNGYTIISDGRFKDDVKESDAPGLGFINELRPVSYQFNYKRYDDFIKKDMNASKIKTDDAYQQQLIEKGKERQVGFIAQEVEKTVKDNGYTFNGVYAPQNSNDNYAIDYSRFVVPLVKSVQELSKQNDDLKSQLAAMQAQIDALQSGSGTSSDTKKEVSNSGTVQLGQIVPNPFSQKATITFSLPIDASNAQLSITDANGKVVSTFPISKGATEQVINANKLSAGVYQYSLIVNGKVMDSKQMVIVK